MPSGGERKEDQEGAVQCVLVFDEFEEMVEGGRKKKGGRAGITFSSRCCRGDWKEEQAKKPFLCGCRH